MKKTGSSFADQHLSMMQANKLALDAKGSEIDMALNMPSPEKDNIDLYANMQKSVGYEKRPNDIWRAALDGLFKGMGHGEKTKFTAEMKKKYDSYLKVGSWIYDWNEKAQAVSEESNKKRAVAAKVSGFVNPIYSAVMGGGDRRQIDEMGRLSFRALQDEGVVPQGMVYSTVDPESMTAIYAKPDGTKGYLDLSKFVTEDARETAKDRVQAIGAQARTMSAEASKLRAQDEHDMFDINKEHKQAYIKDVDNRWDGTSQYNRSYGQQQGKKDADHVAELESQNLHLEDKKWQIKELKDLLKDGKVITGSTIGSWLSRATGKQFNTEKMSETEAFDALSKNLLGFVKGDVKFGNMNQKEFEWLAKQTPDSNMTKGGIERILNRLESSVDRAMKRNEEGMKKRPDYNNHRPDDAQPPPEKGTTTTDKPAGGEQSGGKIPVNKIVNGKKIAGFMTKEQFNKADKNIFELR